MSACVRTFVAGSPLLEREERTAVPSARTSSSELVVVGQALLPDLQRALHKIMVLENGAVAEEGSHAELMRRDGGYRRLWEHQFPIAAIGVRGSIRSDDTEFVPMLLTQVRCRHMF
jgi:hypothetical protein